MDTIKSATEARVHFGEVMRDVSERDEVVIVEHDGDPRIAIVSAERLASIRAQDRRVRPDWRRMLKEIHEQIRREGNVPLSPSPEEVIRQMREERNAPFTDLR